MLHRFIPEKKLRLYKTPFTRTAKGGLRVKKWNARRNQKLTLISRTGLRTGELPIPTISGPCKKFYDICLKVKYRRNFFTVPQKFFNSTTRRIRGCIVMFPAKT